MPHKLRNLKIDRVDLVDKGANQHAHVVLFKRHDGAPTSGTTTLDPEVMKVWSREVEQMLRKTLDRVQKEAEDFDDNLTRRRVFNVLSGLGEQWGAMVDTLHSIANSDEGDKRKLVRSAVEDFLTSTKGELDRVLQDAFGKRAIDETDEAAEARWRAVVEKVAACGRSTDKENTMSEKTTKNDEGAPRGFDLNALPEDVRETVKAEIDRLTDEVEKAKTAATSKEDEKSEDISKAQLEEVPEAVRKHIEALTSRVTKAEEAAAQTDAELKQAQEIAKAERTARERAQYVDQIRKAFPSADAETLGAAMFELNEKGISKEAREALETTMKAAFEQGRVGNVLLKELGHNAPGDDTTSKLDKAAARLREADPTLTKQQAIAKALGDDPSLYEVEEVA